MGGSGYRRGEVRQGVSGSVREPRRDACVTLVAAREFADSQLEAIEEAGTVYLAAIE